MVYVRLIGVIFGLLVSLVNAGYYDDFHAAVETICRNHNLEFFSDVVYFVGKCKKYDSFVRLELVSHGYGLVANRRIKRGDLILSETPIFVLEYEQATRSDEEITRYVEREKLPKLNAYELDEFWRMADSYSTSGKPTIIGIINSNSFEVDDDSGILPKVSRINHSCKPSVEYVWDSVDNVMNVFAIQDVEVNQELFNSYINNLLPRPKRQRLLKEHYHFDCECEVCAANDSAIHDANLAKLNRVYEFEASENAEENVKFLESILELARIEGRENDSILMGEIYVSLVESLLELRNHSYNLDLLARYAFENLTLAQHEDDVFEEYPIFLEKFSYLF